MGTQIRARGSDDTRLYAPNRDVAHNFPFVIEKVFNDIVNFRWYCANKYMDEHKITADDAVKAVDAFVTFMRSAVDNPNEDMVSCLERSGWFSVSDAMQLVLMANIGRVMTGIFFNGAREATLGGEGPCQHMQDLIAAGELSMKLLRMTSWQRLRWHVAARLKGVYVAITGKRTIYL